MQIALIFLGFCQLGLLLEIYILHKRLEITETSVREFIKEYIVFIESVLKEAKHESAN